MYLRGLFVSAAKDFKLCDGDFSCRARNGIIWEDGTWSMSRNTACAAGLNGLQKHAVPLFIVSSIQDYGSIYHHTHAITRKYINWLINDSPWAVVFVEKDIDWVIEHNCLVISAEYPNNLAVGAAVASRMPWEFSSWTTAWNALTEAGMNPSLAYILSFLTRPTAGAYVLKTGYGRSHCATHENFKLNEAKNFILGNVIKPNPPFREDSYYCKSPGLNGIWGGASGYTVDGALSAFVIGQYKAADGVKRTITNPFPIQNKEEKLIDNLDVMVNKLMAMVPAIYQQIGIKQEELRHVA